MRTAFILPVLTAMACGCATVSGTFGSLKPDYSAVPEEALREVALEIERAVEAGNREPGIQNRAGIVVDTPAIQSAIRSRAARAQLVDELLDAGLGWEERSGLVSVKRNDQWKKELNRQQRDRHALVVQSENRDRWTIYEGILEASNYGSKALGAVQAVFFDAQVETLDTGQQYQGPNGEVLVKQ